MRIVRSRIPGRALNARWRYAAVDEAVVDLVAVDEQVVAHGDPASASWTSSGSDRAGRVARVAEEEHLGARRDRRLDRGRVEGEVVLEAWSAT